MFLQQIKMQGFKSFVDLTQLYFNSNRLAIVGPNGCGKSNVIDAIRWVMGETSPKFLRGDSMSDVIFNGSQIRKHSSLASVEIVLDNHLGYLQGPFVGKGQLSLRREINRASESSYFINGKKARRKDLNDLWLGTGAGARGYAIIGQNMVHQLVEANPEVLRGYLEEAAGVSKYKERRKESADKLRHVEDNIARLRDIINELEQSIQRLALEAKDAEVYHQLRQQIRHWHQQKDLAQARDLYLQQQELEARLAQLGRKEQDVKQALSCEQALVLNLETSNQELQHLLQMKEQVLFQKKLELRQAEQQDAERQQLQQAKQQEASRVTEELRELETQFNEEQQHFTEQVNAMQALALEQEHLLVQLTNECGQLQQTEEQLQQMQRQRGGLRQRQNHGQNQIQMLALKLQHARSRLQEAQVNNNQLQLKLSGFDVAGMATKRDDKKRVIEQDKDRMKALMAVLQSLEQEQQVKHQIDVAAKTAQQQLETKYVHLRQQFAREQATYQGYLASLTDIAADTKQVLSLTRIDEWLKTWKIPTSWQPMVNWLWQRFIPAWLGQVDDLDLLPQTFVASLSKQEPQTNDLGLPSLLTVMGISDFPAGFLYWPDIWVADSKAQAFSLRQHLIGQASIITADGLWLGVNWSLHASLESQGLATQLQLLAQLEQDLIKEQQAYEAALQFYQETAAAALEIDAMLAKQQHSVQELSLQQRQDQQELEHFDLLYQHMQTEVNQAQHDLIAQAQACLGFEQEIAEYTQALEQHQQALDELSTAEHELNAQITTKQHQVEIDKTIYHQTKTRFDEGQLKITRLKTAEHIFSQNLPKLKKRLQDVKERQQALLQNLAAHPFEVIDFSTLKACLLEEEQDLGPQRERWSQQKQQLQHKLQQIETLQQAQLKVLEKKWKVEAEHAQILQKIQQLQAELNADFSPSLWQDLTIEENIGFIQQKLGDLDAALSALGDVNLLAIGLYAEERQRLAQLQYQEQDMMHAIEELKKAIATLDLDMQNALQTTLVAINQHLLRIFPQLFGGGEAKFVTSCDNLLEATVAVQVQLPGKKQHRIQLLSGGEKALTAIALLFAIFALNPAPFCLLDEVDAALDDANVLRLAALIKIMSQTVQFILITHNPLTMNVAEELVGVTMQEPGVSRVVSVSMAKALEMVNKE